MSEKWEEMIDEALEGRLSDEGWERLRERVLSDEAVRVMYAERSMLHGDLMAGADDLVDLIAEKEAPVRMRPWGTVGWAAAAAVVAAAAVWVSRPGVEVVEPVAVLEVAEGCRWAGSDLPTTEGAVLGKGTLALTEGMATLRFESGAVVTMEAPTTLEVSSAMRCRLVEGSVVADVPESAHGFRIDTPDLEVVDLGTKFGVTAAAGNAQVVVFEGEVEVGRAGHDGEVELLTTGKSMHLGLEPPVADGEVVREAEMAEVEGGWVEVPTSYGRGKDTYVRFGDAHGPAGGQPLLMVKHTELAERNQRRAYLSFDVGEVALGDVAEAELVLAVRSSGLGFSALIPDSEFSVWGVEGDGWSEEGMLWGDAPAMGLEADGAVRLGGFGIERGAGAGEVRVRSEALAAFLRETGDGVATFIIVRDTGETNKQGLVHAFASREHPTAPAPALRMKLKLL